MFSRKTILEIVKALNFRTHDDVERFSIEFGIEDVISGNYIEQKKNKYSKAPYIKSRSERAEWIKNGDRST